MKNREIFFLLVLTIFATSTNTCPLDCLDCTEDGSQCIACSDGFQLNVLGSCTAKKVDRCVMYGPSDECFQCQYTFTLQNNKCVKKFDACLIQGNIDECLECGFGTKLEGTKCFGVINCKLPGSTCGECAEGYKLVNRICRDQSPYCKQVRSTDGLCSQCKQGYFLSGYKCFESKIRNQRCELQMNNQICAKCKKGYNQINGKCSLSSEINQFNRVPLINGLPSSGGITIIHEGNQIGSNMNNQENFGPDIHNLNNNIVNIQHCQAPDIVLGTCLICQYGYYPKDGKCILVSSLCDGHNIQTGQCFKCKLNLSLKQGKCVDVNCQQIKDDKCIKCKKGFNADQNSVCRQFDQFCQKYSYAKCMSCKQGYYLNANGKCFVLPPNCASANPQNGICIQCSKEYQIITPGSPCVKKIIIQNCEVLDANNRGKCLVCKQRYYPDGSICSKVSNLCKEYNPKNGRCTSCSVKQMSLQQGKCIDPNCNTRKDDTCTQCKQNFIYSQVQNLCRLNDPNCKNLGATACSQCKKGYYISFAKNCKELPLNCQEADQQGNCKTCLTGYEIFQKNCIKTVSIMNCLKVDSVNNKCITCNNRFFNLGNECAPVNQNCDNYNQNNGACLSCKGGMALQTNGACINPPLSTNSASLIPQQNSMYNSQQNSQINTQNQVSTNAQVANMQISGQNNDPNCFEYSNNKCVRCSSKFYLSGDQICVPVNPLCRENNQLGECTNCYSGYSLNSGRCVIALQDPNCKKYSGQVCESCFPSYYYNQNDRICRKINPLCRTSSITNGLCTSCYPGYNLNQVKGACQITGRDPNCRDSNADGTCKSCSPRFYANSNGKCIGVNPLCREYNNKTGGCTSCYPGYSINGEECVKALLDTNCKNMQGTVCRQCGNGFFLNVEGKCKQANPLCRTFDQKLGDCLSCYQGYQISNGNCVVATSQDPNCKKLQGNLCTQCYSGFISINGKCLKQNPLCRSIDYKLGGCQSCWQGYTLVENNCVIDKAVGNSNNDPYCIKFANGLCTQCSNSYYYNQMQKKCQQLDATCKSHDLNSGACTNCFDGFNLVNGKCRQSQPAQIPNCNIVGSNNMCVECNDRYYLTKQNECKMVSLLCQTYNQTTGECTACASNYFLQDGICIYPALFDPNCSRYDASSYCSKCKKGFYLSNFLCVQADIHCIKFDSQTNECLECSANMHPIGNLCV